MSAGDGPTWRFRPDSMAIDACYGFSRGFLPQAIEALRVGPGDRVLEVGCGTGGFASVLLAGLQGKGELVGVDHDGALLRRARDEVDGGTVPSSFHRGDAFHLPFRDDAFDAVVSQFLLCVLPSPREALEEMARVARPGGVISNLSCFCKSGGVRRFDGLLPWPGKQRYRELWPRVIDAYRTTVRNPGLGLPNGRDLEVWGDHHRVGLTDLRITGFLQVFAPADERWTDEEARDYLERRRRIELGLLDGLDDDQLEAMEGAGVPREEVREVRALTATRYEHLLEDVATLRENHDVLVDPVVLISGRVPG